MQCGIKLKFHLSSLSFSNAEEVILNEDRTTEDERRYIMEARKRAMLKRKKLRTLGKSRSTESEDEEEEEGEDEEDIAHQVRMQELRAENQRLMQINKEEDRQLRLEIERRDEVFRRIQELQNNINELIRRRDERNRDERNNGSGNDSENDSENEG